MTVLPSLLTKTPLVLTELLLVIALFLLRLASRHKADRTFPRWLVAIARRPRCSIVLVGALVVLLRCALIPILGIPQPRWHDEFSYLLAADTFAHGRLTNPTPPQWQHFETFHVIMQPTYMSMYPPAQGMVLAVGQLLGRPWIGQLLTTAFMCSAICWMLQGWLPPVWALLGGLLAALRLGILSYWINGYWSASVVALAGALVLGSLPRLKRRVSAGVSVTMAVGMVLLADSRPYEGLVLVIAVVVSLSAWLASAKRPQIGTLLRGFIAPMLVILSLGAIGTGYYYHCVTGSAFRMTYQVDRDTYGSVPFLILQKLRPEPEYRHPVFQAFYDKDRAQFENLRTFSGFLRQSADRIIEWWTFYLGPLLTVPLLALPWMFHDRRLRFGFATLVLVTVALSVVTWFLPHYFAPATCLLYLLIVQGLRHLSRGKLRNANPVRAIVLIACSVAIIRIVAVAGNIPLEPRWPRGNLERSAILENLDHAPGNQIVFVRYSAAHDPAQEWVYNSADLQHAKVIWARDMGTDANRELLRCYTGRNLWRIEPDQSPVLLLPYSP